MCSCVSRVSCWTAKSQRQHGESTRKHTLCESKDERKVGGKKVQRKKPNVWVHISCSQGEMETNVAIAGSRVLYNQGQSRKEVPYQNDLFIVILFRGPLLYNVLIDNVNCVLYLVALFYGPLFRPSIFSWIFDRGQRQSFSGANWHAHEHWGSYLPSGNLCTAGIGRAMLASNLEWCQPVFIEHTQNLYIYIYVCFIFSCWGCLHLTRQLALCVGHNLPLT